MRIVSVVGARPNFMKLFPVARALARRPAIEHQVIHTGQHYDPLLSERLFSDLGLSVPDHHLDVGSGTQAGQTALAMQRLEPLLEELHPDLVLVYGDVNSTLAATLVAVKLGLRVGHVEAGLRSGDRTMPEEVNRLVTDRIADLLFVPSLDATTNLLAEGVAPGQIHFVGNVMIDTLIHALPRAERLRVPARYGVEGDTYLLATLHRPANVDDPRALAEVMAALQELGEDQPVLFPVHPRTTERLRTSGFRPGPGLRLLPPLGYLEMLGLMAGAAAVVTDSGGVQEETTFLGIPCITVRRSTERPITCLQGTNRLVAAERSAITEAVRLGVGIGSHHRPRIERWDGDAGERIAEVVCEGAAVALPTLAEVA